MTTPNGHHQTVAFEGSELPADDQTQAVLELLALADAIESGQLDADG